MEHLFHQSKYKPTSKDIALWKDSGLPPDYINFHKDQVPGRKKGEIVFASELESGEWIGANILNFVALTNPKSYDPLRDDLPSKNEYFVIAYCDPGSINLSLKGKGIYYFVEEKKIKIADSFTEFLSYLKSRDSILADHALFSEIGNPENDYESKEMMILSNNLGVFSKKRWISEYKNHHSILSQEAKITLIRISGGMGEFEILNYLLTNEDYGKPKEVLLELALNSAALRKNPKVVKTLVEMGAALDVGGGPIWDYTSHVKLLIGLGVNPNLKDVEDGGSTLLHRIVEFGTNKDRELVSFLLENGADPLIKNDRGKTPRDVAVEELKDLLK